MKFTQRVLQKIVYATLWSAIKFGCFAVRVLPRRGIFFVSDSLAALGFYLFHDFRRRSIANIRGALADRLHPADAQRVVQRSLRNFFRAYVEIGLALQPDNALRREIDITGLENLEAALHKSNGVIVLSAHLGNFFLIGTRLALEGYATYVLINQPRNGHFAKLADEYRLRVQQRTIHARPRDEAVRELNQVLGRNEVAVMIVDEYGRGNGIRVPLFGRTVRARRGPATLAARTGAAIVPAVMVRQPDDTLRLIVEPELELIRPGKVKSEITENTLRITQWLERTVRSYPDQWNWMNIRSSEIAPEEPEVGDQNQLSEVSHLK